LIKKNELDIRDATNRESRMFPLKLIAAAALIAASLPASAQTYPVRPITLIIPFAAGGPQDVLGRLLAQRMTELLGQQVVVENVGGAGGINGTKRVRDAQPDGYTMGIGSVGTHAHNQTLFRKPHYDASADFAPLALIAESPAVLIARKTLPPTTLPEFISYTKANQAKMQYGSPGAGASSHIACVIFNHAIGVNPTHIPYRGGGPAMQDLIAGNIDYQCDQIVTAKPQIEGGSIKGIAILTKERSPVLPDLPTAIEQGTNVQAYAWTALFMPKRTPDAIVQTLNKAAVETLHTPAVRKRIEGLGSAVVVDERTTPQYLAGFVKSEIEKWAGPIKASGVTMD
jgi:tripartite-type tricarboxylate transporter receptor subunit TctC